MSMDTIIREETRLIVLRELAGQPNYALNESLLQATIERFGINRSRAWLREELRRMEELGAVTITVAGTVMIPTLTTKGLDHVEHRLTIEGIKRPSPRE